MVPPADDEPYPTLGAFVVQFIEEYLCYGPGDLLGKPVDLNPEQRAFLYRMYEVEPEKLTRRKGKVIVRSANPRAGRRRFQRCALSLRKGSTKTEFAAWVAAAELHHDGPVRCAGFEKNGTPIPKPVTDPYIPMISYSEEQTEELAYGALRRILEEMPVGKDFDIGLERIARLDGKGKAEAVSTSPNARDGARTTFQHADETHRLILAGQKKAWTVMLANMAKRPLADPWALETTTAPEPGGGSIAEDTMEYARSVETGRAKDSRLFFFHREAGPQHDITTRRGLKAALVEASGPYVAAWSDIPRIANTFEEPGADRAYLERVWLNRLVQSSGLAFDIKQWRSLKRDFAAPAGSAIAIGFDGSRFDDATAIIATHIESGHQWPLGIWERPPQLAEWEVPTDEVDGIVCDAFERWHVTRMYCDPPKWESWVSKWAGQFGDKRVVEWWTNRRKPMAYALRSFTMAIATGEVTHDGDRRFDDHMGNARQQPTGLVDEDEKPLWILRKERPDSPKKIDAAVTAVISWEARNDTVAAGEGDVAEPAIHFLGFRGR
jgi:phage terminase large subunit-like protein